MTVLENNLSNTAEYVYSVSCFTMNNEVYHSGKLVRY